MKNTYGQSFIDDQAIFDLLERGQTAAADKGRVRGILEKAAEARGLSLEEAGVLIQLTDPELLAELYHVAGQVKESIYGHRLVLFAPLYLSDFCVNNCCYCGYQHNSPHKRRKLTIQEIADETQAILAMGHKRLALEQGEHPRQNPIEYVLEALEVIYAQRYNGSNIRRVNVNIAATTVENYRRLKDAGIGTYVLFQETYHRDTYKKIHRGLKADFERQLFAMHRAMEGGVDDVGLGALFGLYNWRFDVLAMLTHAEVLERDMGVGPHTFSVPRVREAAGVDLEMFLDPVSDADFKKLVAVLRLTAPYAGMLLSTRESLELRREVIAVGISQISAGSRTGVGGYFVAPEGEDRQKPQFEVEDTRTPVEVIQSLVDAGYWPSFCTACYRSGRTGDRFMKLAKSGQIQNVCGPNALLTFQEYLRDFGDARLKTSGEALIEKALSEIDNARMREVTAAKLQGIRQGAFDLRF
ncbi:MAG: [FeFe] hydrogenase H-cluster radical SAM maturase HydG [Candidatus Adiutrix sp.]|nr:[FeFe] hydrogenase H-cluster radical SAM maturase HydG [Candidatus Adiutrix sp.]